MTEASGAAAIAAGPSAAQRADPTLLQLARGGSPWAYVGLLVLVAGALIALLSVTVLRPGKPKGGGAQAEVASNAEGPGFRVDYARGELRIKSASPDRLQLVDRGDDPQGSVLWITKHRLPAYKGSPTGALPLATPAAEREIAARFDPGSVRFTEEGLVNIGPNPGYQLSYVAKRDGATWYGRAAIVLPDVDGERGAVLMDGEEERTATGKIVSPRAVGRQGDLRRPMRSLVFLK